MKNGISRKFLVFFVPLVVISVFLTVPMLISRPQETPVEAAAPKSRNASLVVDVVKEGETFYDIFKRYGLDMSEFYSIKKASERIHSIGKLISGRPYQIAFDGERRVQSLTYSVNDDRSVCIKKTPEGFCAEDVPVEYEKKTGYIEGEIIDNLVSSMDDLPLALALSDIFAWDMDFTTDLRKGDAFKIIVEELWTDGERKKYGDILSAEFVNNGQVYYAYRFEHDGAADYYDEKGRTLRRAFLKAPLSYRRISSRYTKSRFHPILKIYRPHLGVDYSAPTGTPVSAVGDGTVEFSGYKGQFGKLVVVRHPGGYKTYYGHLSRISKGVGKGAKLRQGDIIGYVGSTGLSTGPHLDYRINKDGKFINPITLKLPSRKSLKGESLNEFIGVVGAMKERLASFKPASPAGLAPASSDGSRRRNPQANL